MDAIDDNNFQIELNNFKIASTGTDGGHKYILAEVMHNGIKRNLAIFFANKSDEEKITAMSLVKASGRLSDIGEAHSLHLLDAILIDI